MTTTISNCRFCGMTHGVRCPLVKAIEYFEDGMTVKRVEFLTPIDYQTSPTAAWLSKPVLLEMKDYAGK